MTTEIHADLVERHQAMQAELASQPEALATETILQFLEEARAAGAMIGDVRQREQLRAILRHWGGIIFDRQGDYPATQLAPFAGSSSQPSLPIPPPPSDDVTVTPDSGRWSPLAIGLTVLAGILFVMFLIMGLQPSEGGDSEGASLTEEASIDLTEESLAEGPTDTPTPPSSATIENGEGEGGVLPDEDRDGLSDVEEAEYGTNPHAQDSDGDGLDDWEEVAGWGTDPLNFDTDEDGLLDGEEIEAGTDPFIADSDGDGEVDGEDEAPTQPSTPTFTPSATPTSTTTPMPPTETPTPQTAVPHTVQAGETLFAIAEQYGVSVTQLAEINGLPSQGDLYAGQQLFIPLNSSFIVPELVIKISAVNLRRGPGIEYNVIAFPGRGTFATVLGQTADPTWYLVELQDGKGTQGWLSAAVVRLLHPTRPETIPLVVTVPPTPAP